MPSASDPRPTEVRGPQPGQHALRVTRVTLSAHRFRVVRSRRRPARRPTGTVIGYSLTRAARVTFRITPAGPRARSRRGGLLTRRGRTGRNTLRFTGRIGPRALAPGRYVLTIQAQDRATTSPVRRIQFTVLAG
jgi:hypothetical protein